MLTDYAKNELTRAGLFDKDSDYNGMLGDAVMALVTVFAEQDHSGASAHQTIKFFTELASFRPLTPLTYQPDEFMHVGQDMWQNTRKSTVFSTHPGYTWYDIDEPNRPIHYVEETKNEN